MRLYGKNFQSWADFDLEISGLTIISGSSDVGKSALFRALKGVLRNEISAEAVRNGQDDPAEITVDVGSHSITAKRSKKGSTKYVIDGKDFAKLAGAAPEELKALNFNEVLIGDFDVDPIFGRQNSAQFLIDPLTYKPTEVNAILGAFGGTEKLEHGKKEANLRKTQKDAEARTIAGQMREAEERKAALVGMQVTGATLHENLNQLERDVRGLELDTYWLDACVRYRQIIEPLRQIMDAIVLPDITGLDTTQRLVGYAEQAAEASAYSRWLQKPQKALAAASAQWDDTIRLSNETAALEAILTVTGSYGMLTKLKDELQAVVDQWAIVRILWSQITTTNAALAAGKHLVSTDALKTSLSGVETLYSEAILLWRGINTIHSLALLLGEVTVSAKKLADVETELSAAQAELKKGLCPRCGKLMEHQCL